MAATLTTFSLTAAKPTFVSGTPAGLIGARAGLCSGEVALVEERER